MKKTICHRFIFGGIFVALCMCLLSCYNAAKTNETLEKETTKEETTEDKIVRQLENDPQFSAKYNIPYRNYILETGVDTDGLDGFFVIIESKEGDSFPMGVAFFENISDPDKSYNNIKNDYKLLFANTNAFMCRECNNVMAQSIELKPYEYNGGYYIELYAYWGPSIGRMSDFHRFIFDKTSKKWILSSIYAERLSGERFIDTDKYKIPLDEYNIEGDGFAKDKFKPEYNSEDWRRVAKDLEVISKNSSDEYLRNPLLMVDVLNMIKDINLNNVQAANDCAYFLEMIYEEEQAEVILKKILEQFPDRIVAYLNIGDVYRKQEKNIDALNAYEKYLELMTEKGWEAKIPDHVPEFIEQHK